MDGNFAITITAVDKATEVARRINEGITKLTKPIDDLHKSVKAFGPSGHSIKITGRGRCQDLVDCSAEWNMSQMSAANALTIANNLASAYSGITVSCDVSDLVVVPQFNIMLGETAFEIIDRVCKYSGLLAYDGTDGSLILSRVGTEEHSSGLSEGKNVTAAAVRYSMDQRYSQYIGWLNAMVRIGSNSFSSSNTEASGTDSTVLRNRKKFLIAEATYGYQDLLQKRVNWEMNRRNGRSKVAHVTVDSWHDGEGSLWTPNKLVSIYLPALKLVNPDTGQALKWIIGDVTFTLGEKGTFAQLTLMEPSAFEVAPANLNYGLLDPAMTN